jgi:type 1 fimbriae regulatory protein FimB/type 1 fimbriae regulatory protein FimE
VPILVNGTVEKARCTPPQRRRNVALRPREYLTEAEVERLMQAAQQRGRYGVRDAAMILLAYRHGLRVGELCALRWDQVDFAQGLLHVGRCKNGTPSVHPLRGPELRVLRKVKRDNAPGAYVFMSERGAPMTAAGFRKLLSRTGAAAGFGFGVHPHMLRHACGYKLANDGCDTRAIQHYLGHKNIGHTVRYTQLSAERFKGFWND